MKQSTQKRKPTRASTRNRRGGFSQSRVFVPPSPSLTLTAFPSYFADQPPVKYAKLKYTTIETIANIGAGAITVRQFRANDLYDPDYAVGGHQPYGFDQLIAQYHHFTVIHSALTFEIMDVNEYKSAFYQIHLSDAAGEVAAAFAAGSYAAIDEMPLHSTTIAAAIDGAHSASRSVTYHFDARVQFRKDIPSLVGNTAYSGSSSASPVEDAYFEVVGFAPAQNAVTYAFSGARYTITYWAVFSEPKLQVPS